MSANSCNLARLTKTAFHSAVCMRDCETAAATSRILGKFNDLTAAKKAVTNYVAPMGP